MNGKQLYLKPDEAKFLGMSVVTMLENLMDSAIDPELNWTPETRKLLKEMIHAGTNLKIKLSGQGFDMRPLPPFENGDETEFLTKQS
jgi:hypothetical protein